MQLHSNNLESKLTIVAKIEAVKFSNFEVKMETYRECLPLKPSFYKIWRSYLEFIEQEILENGLSRIDKEILEKDLEQAVSFMSLIPRVWIYKLEIFWNLFEFLKFIETLDLAIEVLPITQHSIIWKNVISLAEQASCSELYKILAKKYLLFENEYIEKYVDRLLELKDIEEGIATIDLILEDENFISKKGKSNYEYSLLKAELIAQNPILINEEQAIKFYKSSIEKYEFQRVNFWICLIEFWIRKGEVDQARSEFKEAATSAKTVSDFLTVHNAWLKFEEDLLVYYSEELKKGDEDFFDLTEQQSRYLDSIIKEREILLSNAKTYEQQDNPLVWLEHFEILRANNKDPNKAFFSAVKSLENNKAKANILAVWVYFLNYYREYKGLKTMNKAFFKFMSLENHNKIIYSGILCSWAETLLSCNYLADVLKTLRYFLGIDNELKSQLDMSFKKARSLLQRDNKIWSLYLDLVFTSEGFNSYQKAIDKALDLKIISISNCLIFLQILEKTNQMKSYLSYTEKFISVFPWPAKFPLVLLYLEKLETSPSKTNIEIIRYWYECYIEASRGKQCWTLNYLYAKFEERNNNISIALKIYKKLLTIKKKIMEDSYLLLIAKQSEYKTLASTRAIFEEAIERLEGDSIVNFGHLYARVELKLGEIDRVRGIYAFVAQFCEPEIEEYGFWEVI